MKENENVDETKKEGKMHRDPSVETNLSELGDECGLSFNESSE